MKRKTTILIVIILNIVALSITLYSIFGVAFCNQKINEMRNGMIIEGTFNGIFIPSNVTVYLVNGMLYKTSCFMEDMKPIRGIYFDDTKEIFIQTGNKTDVYLYHEILHYKFRNILNSSKKKEIEKVYKTQCENSDEYYAYMNSIVYEKAHVEEN